MRHPAIDTISRALGGLVWVLLFSAKWAHAQFVAPVGDWLTETTLPAYEEITKVR